MEGRKEKGRRRVNETDLIRLRKGRGGTGSWLWVPFFYLMAMDGRQGDMEAMHFLPLPLLVCLPFPLACLSCCNLA